ncbi:ecto-ADP-ribosyltransferase 5-like [Cyprinus carpio]|uniref:NAD(P)(+)--arginine ADP-ribosyltransferase n=1 Tax=Cyprinus carpio TaxID=7962 RepID=A0A9R0ASS1_CYPCA|nr:ecto-ADP-ribosyltransferase 5-like [Cyprinus carpio]
MLLITEAFLLILVVLGQVHRAAAKGEIFPLDMAEDSVDDQYDGCTEKMTQLVETKYLENEKSASPEFKSKWENGEENAMKPEDNLEKKHSVAIYVYTGKKIYRDFNEAVRSDKGKYKTMAFKWYSLHFLLTEAIQILKKTQPKCYSTYRGVNIMLNKDVLNKKVRLGSFTSSSHDRSVAQRFGNVSCFEIHTCEGAELIKYSQFPKVKEVLIPPYETFIVTEVKTKSNQTDLWCETVFTLNNTGKISYLNCGCGIKAIKAPVEDILDVRAFYVEVIGKMLKVFPLDSQLLCDLKVLDPASRLEISPETG